MDRDTAKLQGIARDLSQLGLELINRVDPPDEAYFHRIGDAFIAISEAVADITLALERGASQTKDG